MQMVDVNGGGLLDGLFRRRRTIVSPQSSTIQSIFYCVQVHVIAFAVCHSVNDLNSEAVRSFRDNREILTIMLRIFSKY